MKQRSAPCVKCRPQPQMQICSHHCAAVAPSFCEVCTANGPFRQKLKFDQAGQRHRLDACTAGFVSSWPAISAWQGDAGLTHMAQLAGDAPVQVHLLRFHNFTTPHVMFARMGIPRQHADCSSSCTCGVQCHLSFYFAGDECSFGAVLWCHRAARARRHDLRSVSASGIGAEQHRRHDIRNEDSRKYTYKSGAADWRGGRQSCMPSSPLPCAGRHVSQASPAVQFHARLLQQQP